MSDRYVWEPAIPLPDEHRLFPARGNPFKWVAIADNSGRSPESTDDGVLWLDFDRDLLITRDGHTDSLSIPVKRGEDENPHGRDRFHTVTNMSTMLWLSSTFEWAIEDRFNKDDIKYVVRSAN
jgi:hypothetical protein